MQESHSEAVLIYAMLGFIVVTGLVDAVSFLALGHVFTANMTGNIVFLAFAIAGTPGLSIARSSIALVAFLVGALLGGRTIANRPADSQPRWGIVALIGELVLLLIAAIVAVGYQGIQGSLGKLYSLISLTGVAMGIRNATVRKLAIPDMTTTVLTLTITGLAADSSLAGGTNLRWRRRTASVIAMFVGAGAGAMLVRVSVPLALASCALMTFLSNTALMKSIGLHPRELIAATERDHKQ